MYDYKQIYKFESGPFNWYLIEQDSRLTLVDAGFPGHYSILEKGLSQLGKSIQDIEAIVVTHAHADHTGFASLLNRKTGVPVYIHGDDAKAVKKVLQLPWYGLLSNTWRPYISKMLLHATLNGVFRMPTLPKVETIVNEQVLDVPGNPHVIHTPGHTTGQIALFLPERSVLLSSDALVTRNLLTGQSVRPEIPHRVLNDDDLQTRKSTARLRGLGHMTLLPGHGLAWEGDLDSVIEEV